MKRELVFILLLFPILCSAQLWETHLNLRESALIIKAEPLSILVKRKINDEKYFRLGLSGYFTHYGNADANGIIQQSYNFAINPGIEKRKAFSDKLFFLYGFDLKYAHSGTNAENQANPAYSRRLRVNYFGASLFLGIHYQISKHLAVLTETHLNTNYNFNRARIRNDFTSPKPNRTEEMNQFDIGLLPFKYLTIAFTF